MTRGAGVGPRRSPPHCPCCWCWCGVVVVVPASGIGPSSCGLGAPAIHPTSSCSSAWGGCSVVHRPRHPVVVCLPVVPVVVVVLFSPSPLLLLLLLLLSMAARSWPGARQCRHWLLTPTIHPASSCSQAWGRVLGRLSSLGCSVAVFRWWRWCCGRSCLPSFCLPSPSLSSAFHPRSTPRAVARGAGGGWCVVRRRGWLWWGPGARFHRRHLFWGVWAGQHDAVRLRGSLGAYLVGISLLGSPGVVLRAPDLKRHSHIPFRRGGGDSAAVGMGGWCPVSVLRYHYNGI